MGELGQLASVRQFPYFSIEELAALRRLLTLEVWVDASCGLAYFYFYLYHMNCSFPPSLFLFSLLALFLGVMVLGQPLHPNIRSPPPRPLLLRLLIGAYESDRVFVETPA